MDSTPITLTLELEVADGGGLTGRATCARGVRREFAGWLGLVAAIDAYVPDAPTRASQEESMTTIETPTDLAGALRDRLDGTVVAPADPGWDAARQAFNLTVDQRPDLIAIPSDTDDVARVIAFARDHDLRVAAQRTAHNAGPLGDLAGTILLKTDALGGVEIDPVARKARVGAGIKWADVVPAASELGLAALHGSTPDVSIAGYSMGGGIGWYSRKHGLAANKVTAIELVTADGTLRRVDHRHEPELFWALRGGGGNFGVVTAIEFELLPVPEVYAGILFFPFERAAEVLKAWLAWTKDAPEEVTSVGRIMQFPPIPEVPEPMRGKSFALVEAIYLGDATSGAKLLEPLRALGPVLDTIAMVPPVGLSELHMDPTTPMPFVSTHALLGDIGPDAIDALLAVAGPGSGSTLASVELRHSGGALARPEPHDGAVSAIPGSYVLFGGGLADPVSGPANEGHVARLEAAAEPFRVGSYFNFEEDDEAASRFFDEATYRRLQAVKTAYDPQNVFKANHEIPPA